MMLTLKTAATRLTIGLALALLTAAASPVSAAEPPQATPAQTGATSTPAPAAGTATTVPAPAGPASEATATKTAAATTEPPKVVCRDEKVTGSKLRSRKVCSSADSESKSGDWVRNQQARGAIGASAILNGQ